MKETCCLVYAVAPASMSWDESNLRLNEYLLDERRGLCIAHDHFADPNGGFAVFHVRTAEERAALDRLGPLEGWSVKIHSLIFGTTAVGFMRQSEFTLQRFRGVSVEELALKEGDDPSYWWKSGDLRSWINSASSTDTRLTGIYDSKLKDSN
ncbi:hypothetical protein [Mesorhizobium sp. M1329]|uniref:hypothetical protein n=1 Tax=Mesorhizobium sp. M1329 TaxID=2957083 RepID=UPI003339AF05